MSGYSIGLDVGGTAIKTAVMDPERNVIHKDSFPSPHMPSESEFILELLRVTDATARRAGIADGALTCVGVGLPGIVNGGTVHRLPNVGITDLELGRELEQRLGIPVMLDNDANVTALAEHLLGAGRGCDEMLVLTLGTGLGGGAISGGRILRGIANLACEFGHITLNPDGPTCSCGNEGCFEAYCSATALYRHIRELAPDHPASDAGLDAKRVFDGYHEGDAQCSAVVRRFMTYLAHGVMSLVSIFNPELIVIAGGISNQGAWMIDELQQAVDARLMHGVQRAAIKQAALGSYAGAYGAALLHTQ